MPDLKAFTVVVVEKTSPYPPVSPWPLIYTLKLKDPTDKGDVLDQVAQIRFEELDGDDHKTLVAEEVFDAIRDGLELLFAFEGDLTPVEDWRE